MKSTDAELERSVYAKMAEALDLIEEAYDIATEVYDGMMAKHGNLSSDYRSWMVDIKHAMDKGDKIRPKFRYVEFK